jgi:hypothetical protein
MAPTRSLRHEKVYDTLSAIAPTAYGDRAGFLASELPALRARARSRGRQSLDDLGSVVPGSPASAT